MTHVNLKLDQKEKDPCDWLNRMINLADKGTRIVYWTGKTDVKTEGKRKKVFEFMMKSYEDKRVILMQKRVEGGYDYIAEVV